MKQAKTKKIVVTLVIVALVATTAIAFFGCKPTIKTPNAYVTIDINPSVELITGTDGKVKTVTPLNDDAATLLVDVNLKGMTLDKALDKVLSEAEKTGYIADGQDNAVVVTADAGTEKKTADLQKKLDKRVSAFAKESKLNIDVINASEETDPALAERAKAAGVSFGKMKLVELAMKYDNALTLDAAKGMAVKDLNAIVVKAREQAAEFLTEQMRREFELFKATLDAEEEKEEYRLLNEAVQNASADKLASVIGDYDVAAFKARFAEMYAKIAAIDISALETAAAPTLTAEEEQSLKDAATALANAKKTFKETVGAGQKDKHAVRDARKEIHRLDDALDDIIDAIEDKYETTAEIDIEVFVNDDGTVAIDVQVDADDLVEEKIEAIEEEYYGAFEAQGIDAEEIEDLFEDELDKAEDAFEAEADRKIAEYKANLKTQIDAVNNALKAEKEALKTINA